MPLTRESGAGLACLQGARVLVTGGAGFLGSNLSIALAERGARVTVIDAFLPGGGGNMANLAGAAVQLVRADIRDADLRPLCEDTQIIFNLARISQKKRVHRGRDSEKVVAPQ